MASAGDIRKEAPMLITKEQLTEAEAEKRGIPSWSIWEHPDGRLDWYYEQTEQCWILEGKVTVETGEQKVEIGPQDFVTFPKGLRCVWIIHEPVRKHYTFVSG
jgi:uncharacterized protein